MIYSNLSLYYRLHANLARVGMMEISKRMCLRDVDEVYSNNNNSVRNVMITLVKIDIGSNRDGYYIRRNRILTFVSRFV